MDWSNRDGWPLAETSRRINGPRHRWHVQEAGDGPLVLLLHGAGGSTHSMAPVVRSLGPSFHTVSVDLPGHGFTQLGGQQRSGLAAMATDLRALCDQEGWVPDLMVAHSSGAAVAMTMAPHFDPIPPVIGINAALESFDGVAGVLFPALAKLLASVPFTASLFSSTARSAGRVESLIRSTGSTIPDSSMACYRALVADRAHVDGALKMMAQWSLDPLWAVADRLGPVTLVAAGNDTTVAPEVSHKAAPRLPKATVVDIPGYGHLIHEEAPERIMDLIRAALAQTKTARQE
ncbi:MAG: alpha/beta fold hydrolase BchO [Pseudomonadota bacterium]